MYMTILYESINYDSLLYTFSSLYRHPEGPSINFMIIISIIIIIGIFFFEFQEYNYNNIHIHIMNIDTRSRWLIT